MTDYKNSDTWRIFSHNMKWLRNHHKYSKERMAETLDITVEMVDEIENGYIPDLLNVQVFFKIHKAFSIKPKDMVGIYLGNE